MSPEAEWSFDNTYSVKRGQPFDVPFQNPGTSKGLKKCLNAKRHSGQLACGSDNPLAPFNNIFPLP